MSESFVQVPPDSTGKKLRAILRTIEAQQVLEQILGISVGGTLIDPRSIRALTSADIVSAIKSGTWNIDNLLNPHPVSLASIPNPSNLDVALSTRATGTVLNPHPVSLAIIPNPSNLDVALSTRATGTLLNPHPVSLSALLNPHPVSLSTLLNPHPVFAFSTSTPTDQKALVDADRHLQVDVLSGGGGGSTRNTIGVYSVSSFRTLGSAATPHNLFTIENPNASGKKIAILELKIIQDSTAVLASVAPSANLSRPSAMPTGELLFRLLSMIRLRLTPLQSVEVQPQVTAERLLRLLLLLQQCLSEKWFLNCIRLLVKC